MTPTPLHRGAGRRQLQQIAAGLSEGVILIEPDRTLVWANDAALGLHGVATIDDLGRDVDAYRERFMPRQHDPHTPQDGRCPIERVISGDGSTDVLVEVLPAVGRDARRIHRMRGLVLTDGDGDPEVLALVFHDADGRADAERCFERMFDANPAPALVCRLSDLRHVRVNREFLALAGCASDDLIGRTVFEFDVFGQVAQRDVAIERLRRGLAIAQMEAELRLPAGCRPVIVAGQPVDIGDEGCMLLTFVDLAPRHRAEEALRLSEERCRKAFRMLPVPGAVLRAEDLALLDVNEAFCLATDQRPEHLVGTRDARVSAWLDPFAQSVAQHLERSDGVRDVELRVDFGDGRPVDCLMSAERVSIAGQACIVLTWFDITERKRAEMELVGAVEMVLQDTTWRGRSLAERLADDDGDD